MLVGSAGGAGGRVLIGNAGGEYWSELESADGDFWLGLLVEIAGQECW